MSNSFRGSKDCADRFARYELTKASDEMEGMTVIEVFQGLPAKTRDGKRGIHKTLGCNRFERKVTAIPKGARKKKYQRNGLNSSKFVVIH